jgi:hypothetical protein
MDAVDKKILNNYFGLLEGLNPTMKSNLIDRLSKSIKSRTTSKSKIKLSFGGWESNETSETLIKSIRNSRNTNRQIEEF